MAAGDDREAALTRDYNLEMLEHVDRHRNLRDQAVFVGAADDIVEGTFGDGLPRSGTGPVSTTTSPATSPPTPRPTTPYLSSG